MEALSAAAPRRPNAIQLAAEDGVCSVIMSPTPTDKILAEVALATAVSVELGGSPELPPLPASRTVDGATSGLASTADATAFSADMWSISLPHGFALCERRAISPYDGDVLEFFEQLAVIEDQYAKALQALNERLSREHDGGHYSLSAKSGWRWGGLRGATGTDRPLCRSVQYASMQHAWSATRPAKR